RLILFFILFRLSIAALSCIKATDDSTQDCSGDQICRVVIIGKTIVERKPCSPKLKADCERRIVNGLSPKSSPSLAFECQCSTTGCDKVAATFDAQISKIFPQPKKVNNQCHTMGDTFVLMYTILFGVSIATFPLVLFMIIRLCINKRKMDKVDQNVTSSLRQLQTDMMGTTNNVFEVRKKMEQLTSGEALPVSAQRETGRTSNASPKLSTDIPSAANQNSGDQKKDDSATDPKADEKKTSEQVSVGTK
ncbi:hypothetical protein PFISCL1PPCAC_24166, partial [Pristionchus fissidentatus]